MGIISFVKKKLGKVLSPNLAINESLFDFDYEQNHLELGSLDLYIERYTTIQNEKNAIDVQFKKASKLYTMYQKIVAIGETKLERIGLILKNLQQIEETRETFHLRMNKVGKEYEYIAQFEPQFNQIVKELQSQEDRNRLLKSDMNILDVENTDLKNREIVLIKTRKIIDGLMIGMIMVFAIFAAVLMLQVVYNQKEIMTVSLIFVCVTVFFMVWIVIFRRYTIIETKKNRLLQKRAIQLINKTKLHYVNNESSLDFVYKKYKTFSSEQLIHHMEQYQNYKKDLERFQNLCRNESAAYEDLLRYLEKYHISEFIEYIDSNRNSFDDTKKIIEQMNKYEREYKYQSERVAKNQKEIAFISNVIQSFIDKQPKQSQQVITKKLEVNGIHLDKSSLIV